MKTSRRKFIKKSLNSVLGVSVATMIPKTTGHSGSGTISPNEKIGVALIGCHNHGFTILKKHLMQPEVECIALCDVDREVLESRAGDTEEITGRKPKLYHDFRKLLENKDVDAVIIGTPDHWHCLMLVSACEAGKDIYLEKPMANSIKECYIIVTAAEKYQRIVQVGQQQRSGQHWKDVMAFLRTGKLGQLRKIKIWANFHYGVGRPIVPDEPVPETVNFDMWLGPAAKRTFNRSRFHGNWRMFWDYGGGLMTDWGVHLIDMALWAKDVTTPPKSVTAIGGVFSHPDCAHETPDNLTVIYEMDNYSIEWEHVAGVQSGPYNMNYGIAYIGNSGTLVVNRDGWEVFPDWQDDKPKMEAVPKQEGRSYHEDHVKNFLACIKSREKPACDVNTGFHAAFYSHLGNIAFRSGDQLIWDKVNNQFANSEKANELITPVYREPWQLPDV